MGDATTVDMKEWDRDIRINVTSMVLMCRYVVPEMRKVGRGAIVNLSSVSGREYIKPGMDLSYILHIDLPGLYKRAGPLTSLLLLSC